MKMNVLSSMKVATTETEAVARSMTMRVWISEVVRPMTI